MLMAYTNTALRGFFFLRMAKNFFKKKKQEKDMQFTFSGRAKASNTLIRPQQSRHRQEFT